MAELREFRLPDVGRGSDRGRDPHLVRRRRRHGRRQPDGRRGRDGQGGGRAADPVGRVSSPRCTSSRGSPSPVGTALLTVDVAVPTRSRRTAPDEAPDEAPDNADPEVLAPAPSAATETMGARPEADLVPSGPPPQARREAVLVGYGVREAAVTRRPRRRSAGGARLPPRVDPGQRPVVPRARPSHRCASWPRTSAWTWRTSRRPDPTGRSARDDVLAQAPVSGEAPSRDVAANSALSGEVVLAAGARRGTARARPRHPQAHGRGNGPQRLHDPARHRVDGGRRQSDGADDPTAARDTGLQRRPRLPPAARRPGGPPGASSATRTSMRCSTPTRRRSSIATRSTSASQRRLRGASWCRTSRTPAGCRSPSSPRRWTAWSVPPAKGTPPRRTCPGGRSPSRTSACSASTAARPSSTRASRRSSRWGRSGSGRGSTRAGSSRAGSLS